MTMPIGWICCETGEDDNFVFLTMKNKIQPGDLWADSGCVRGVGGEEQHQVWAEHLLKKLNLKPVVMPCNEQFQFGDGHVEKSTKKYLYPSFFLGKFRGVLDQASVPLKCPQLLSKGVMKTWDVDLRFGKGVTFIGKWNVEIPFNDKDIPMVNVFEVTPEQVQQQWHKIPDHFKATSSDYDSNLRTPPKRRSGNNYSTHLTENN